MHISVIVALEPGEELGYDNNAAAVQVLAALGGDEATDYCVLTTEVRGTPAGMAGKVPDPPPLEEEPEP